MGQVLAFTDTERVDDAWEAYRLLAEQVVNNPLLFIDRSHAEARIRAFRRFEHLFLIGDRA